MDLKKELSVVEILSTSWDIFKDHFQTIAVITLLIYIPIEILYEYIPSPPVLTDIAQPWGEAFQDLRKTSILEGLIGIVATMGIALITKEALKKKEMSVEESLKTALVRWPYALGTSLIMGLFLLGLLLLLIVPGIIYAVYWQFAILAVVLSGVSGTKALKYSKSMVAGRWWKTLRYSLVFGVLTLLTAMALGSGYAFIPEGSLLEKTYDVVLNVPLSYFSVVAAVFFLHFEATKA